MRLTDLEFIAINSTIDFTGFDCGDFDIFNWLKEDALEHRNQRIANTYLFVTNDQVVAYFCISNDSLNDLGEKKDSRIVFGTDFIARISFQIQKGSEIIRQ